jgi:type I restriction enzyme, S subunit
MIDGLCPYSEMRPSGLRWLGNVPAHWEVCRNGRLFSARRETGFPDLPILEVSIRSGVRLRDLSDTARKQEMTDRSKYQRAARGDIAYNMMRMWQGAVGVVPADGLVSPAYIVARPFPRTDATYYSYLFRIPSYLREIEIFSRGIVPDRNRLYWESFKQMQSVYPPLEEQQLIVRFLQWHGAQTAKMIHVKKQFIALLTEQKQSIVHHAVTRGLDSNVRLKPSGIPWLGDVPEGWGVTRLRSISRQITSGSRGWSRYASDHGPLFIRIANLSRTGLHLRFDDIVRLALPASELGEAARTRVEAGDILLSITAYIGSVAVVPNELGEAYVSQHVACCRLSTNVNPRWIGYVLLSSIGKAHGTLSMYGGTKQGLSLDDVKNYVVLLPPHRIQRDIATWIDISTDRISKSIAAIENEILRLREFRTRLITDVVTGKLDVRSVAARLPGVSDLEPNDGSIEEGDLDEEAIDETDAEDVAA